MFSRMSSTILFQSIETDSVTMELIWLANLLIFTKIISFTNKLLLIYRSLCIFCMITAEINAQA